ncbi:GGDEF domain-containing phosphodiesterase [Colwellia psychrerythraea]|uniref:Diguanylate cyclase/phosphodiesterase n=1 Tax=Colwellia psychrerythraea TaxID=28229 RepID=A0A099KML1_COLPS|nr:GGDEF domain-containing phosphodiesterase [Colwellia psychrerythraea]KGJ91122.1 diguanylate cyclase/phosphodiesterase [Colwellia psychrerythraea]
MSSFNAKYFFVFVIFIAVIALSALFAQLYSEQLPIGLMAMVSYLVAISIAIILAWFLTQKIFSETPTHSGNETISVEELFIYTHDPVTNLPTAQQALKTFESAIKSDKGNRYGAVVFKPINFQQVNSLLGYHNSDLLLLQLAYCLQQRIAINKKLLNFGISPEPVRIARLQSLQFLVVYDLTQSRYDDKAILDELCQQLGEAVPNAMSFKSFSLNFELAFGIAISDENGDSVEEVISHAGDALLNGLKSQQIISYFDNSSILYTQSQLARMESFRQDIQDKKLHCYLEPQVNINNYNIVGFQLKVHWYESSNAKPLELSDFSKLAEQSGELYGLTKQMLDQAFTTLEILHRIGVYQRISVSLANESLFEVDLVDFIEQKLQQYGIAGKYLMIELNEQVMLSASHRVKSIIDQLKSLEINISISNFSGSYESLRYVRKVAIHQLKVNCQQLSNDSSNRVDKAITNALVTLTRSMKIPLIGTNIDRHDSSQAYIAMGGELMQGDIIHSGVVPEEIEIWLEKWYLQHPESIPPEARPSIY